MYVWTDCFCSDLFHNQIIANAIFQKYDSIRGAVSNDIGWIVLSLLQQNNVDAIHRLIEKCLEFEMKRECSVCLTALFDYHCK